MMKLSAVKKMDVNWPAGRMNGWKGWMGGWKSLSGLIDGQTVGCTMDG